MAPPVRRAAVYFVASPLQYLAARQIARQCEPDSRQVLVWYQPGLAPIVQDKDWDACLYMPWPRHQPMAGPFGRVRRMLDNLKRVAAAIGPTQELVLHSAVFDTEAINYFLKALPRRCGSQSMQARILPDGLISTRRYPLSPLKQALQRVRTLRGLILPDLRYTCFSGDRIGSDAPFVDRIYVLQGLPNEYPASRTFVIDNLLGEAAPVRHDGEASRHRRRALVIGQPMVGAGLMSAASRDSVTSAIQEWLRQEGFDEVHYKAHPKDPNRELWAEGYEVLPQAEPIESRMSQVAYDVVVGTRSTALLLAKQIYGAHARALAFGWEGIRFKSSEERHDMERTFKLCGVELMPPPASADRLPGCPQPSAER